MFSLFLYLLVTFLSGYFAIERIGLFSLRPLSTINIIHSLPFLAGLTGLFILVSFYILSNNRISGLRRWSYLVAMSLIISGLLVSYFTGFYVEVIITEGQGFYSGHDEYLSIYKGKFARPPEIGIKLEKLSPEFSKDSDEIKRLRGEFLYFRKGGGQTRIVITNRMPRLVNGMMFMIKGFGYSPRFVLKSKGGKVLFSSFVYMRLFPEGNEDFFRLLSPHTYYLRYYPSRTDKPFRLRIVRNKDIVFNDDIRLSEEVPFDNGVISFEEVRKWTRLLIIRDWGKIISVVGAILILLTLLPQKLALRKCKFL
jgi:hypothetical protein